MDTSPFPAKNPLYITLSKVRGRVQKLQRRPPSLSVSLSSLSPLPSLSPISFLSTLSCGRRKFNRVVPKYGRHWRKCVNHAGRKYSRRVRVRTIRGGARVQKSFFAAAQRMGARFLRACLRNEFRAFSEHSLLLPRYIKHPWNRCSLSTMIDRRSWNENNSFRENFLLIHQFFQSSSDAVCLSNLIILLMTRIEISSIFLFLNILIHRRYCVFKLASLVKNLH